VIVRKSNSETLQEGSKAMRLTYMVRGIEDQQAVIEELCRVSPEIIVAHRSGWKVFLARKEIDLELTYVDGWAYKEWRATVHYWNFKPRDPHGFAVPLLSRRIQPPYVP
jgi:hypothetical protein